METRTNQSQVTIETRADGSRKIKGLASPVYNGSAGTEYELMDGVFERFMPGAFDRHLQTAPEIISTYNHDKSKVLGRTPHTLRVWSERDGLHYEVDLPETSFGKDLLISIERGDVKFSSFGFIPSKAKWTRDGDKEVREIHEAKLISVDPVTVPAYGGSNVGLRSAEERAAIEAERQAWLAEVETEKREARLKEILSK